MKIELKKLSINELMSEETTMFIADLYINGKKVGYCKNDGRGGCTDYHGNTKENNELIKEAEAYCKTLPNVKYGNMEWEQNLENVIDEFIENHLKAKAEKKMLKLMQTSLIWGNPNGNRFGYINYKIPLTGLAKTVPQMLQTRINQIKKDYCTNGVVILNTNLVELGLNV